MKRKAQTKKAKAPQASNKKRVQKAQDKANIKTVQTSQSGGTCVDHELPGAAKYKVESSGGKDLSCYLMYSDCKQNNNKYYIIQALSSGTSNYLWTRWGRVGKVADSNMVYCGSKAAAEAAYNKKYKAKVNGTGYKEVGVKFGQDPTVEAKLKKAEEADSKKREKDVKSKLDANVQDLISFIFDTNLMT